MVEQVIRPTGLVDPVIHIKAARGQVKDLEEEVRKLVGERSQRQPERTANRWGKECGYCVVMGQKVPIKRPRVRTREDQEVRLGSYELFHRGEPPDRNGVGETDAGPEHEEIRPSGA